MQLYTHYTNYDICQWSLTFVSHTLGHMADKNIDDIYKEIGKRVVSARKKKGMSQEKLATESGVDRSHMGFIEQGRRKPTISTLYRIVQVLDLKLEDLFKSL